MGNLNWKCIGINISLDMSYLFSIFQYQMEVIGGRAII